MIELKNVSFSYKDKKVLDDFSLKVNDGERICLFGQSGIGKTTIIRLILGLERAQSGEVINTSKPSVVYQEDRLLPFITVMENIKMFSDKGDDEIADILQRLCIYEYRDKYPSQLSGGISRRTALARALCINADVYILDEPFSALDSENISLAVELINEITENKTLVLITHNMDDAENLNCKIKALCQA